ncbi:MAG TPA: endonuclease/exonuclease/phosphatase family protein [Mycobacteriales bacterium]|nr:endonuclease/exonuclease/phosphatase family protein [Mycobacteriales bacterium]
MRHSRARSVTVTASAVTAGLIALAGAVALSPSAGAAPSTGVVVNEVYGGGGNSGATYTNDFIELANRGSAASTLDGWSVQYISASPGASTTWQVTALSGSVASSDRYLVGEAAGTGGTTPLPTTQATGTINLSGTAGTVALVDNSTALTCKTAADCAADPDIVDLVGYGTAAVHEGSADAPATTNTTSAQRNSTPDTDDNGADFSVAAPTPGAANSGGGGGGGGGGTPGPLRIHDIQGTTWLSPQAGNPVTNVPGIVTGVRAVGSSKGYWIQDPNPDDNPATSEGIFVFTGSAPTVNVGDSVLVSGKVSEFYPLASGDTVSATSNLSITEIDATSSSTLSSGNSLPAPIVLTPSTVPDTYAPDLGGGNIESTSITPSRSALDYYESIEGMRVEVDDARVVGPSDSFGEQYVTTKPDQLTSYRGGTMLRAENATPSGRLEVVPVDGSNPEVNVGDVFQGATIGPIDYSLFGGYLIAATTLGAVQHNNLPPVVASGPTKKQLSVATYNVENLAATDPESKFQALAHGVVTNLDSPDVIAVEEIQDNDGATNDGVVAADQTIDKLTSAITAAGGPSYSSREIDPVNDQDGGEPGGNIRVVFLYNSKVVSFVDSGASSVNRSTTGTQVVKQHGEPALSLSPGRIDPTNPVWTASRKPLVGEFTFQGKDVFVIANHFDAKLGDQNADGRFQFPAQSSATQRAGQAQVEHDFVGKLLAIDKRADVVVVGDLNDYQFSPALSVLKTGTADGSGASTLTDLITTLPVNQQYTYDFDGISEVLDHILITKGISKFDYQVVHVNSEYANQVSDHDPQVVDLTP